MSVWQRYSLSDLESGDAKTVKRIQQGNAARLVFVAFEAAAGRAAAAMRRFAQALEVRK